MRIEDMKVGYTVLSTNTYYDSPLPMSSVLNGWRIAQRTPEAG